MMYAVIVGESVVFVVFTCLIKKAVFASLRIYVISVRHKVFKVALVAVFGTMFVICDAVCGRPI